MISWQLLAGAAPRYELRQSWETTQVWDNGNRCRRSRGDGGSPPLLTAVPCAFGRCGNPRLDVQGGGCRLCIHGQPARNIPALWFGCPLLVLQIVANDIHLLSGQSRTAGQCGQVHVSIRSQPHHFGLGVRHAKRGFKNSQDVIKCKERTDVLQDVIGIETRRPACDCKSRYIKAARRKGHTET